MAEIKWTHEAARWLEEIHDYIRQDNPSAAGTVVSGIYDKIQTLADFPRLGQTYRTEPEGEIRILHYGHYRIAYLVSDRFVYILGIFHGALDIERYLPSPGPTIKRPGID